MQELFQGLFNISPDIEQVTEIDASAILTKQWQPMPKQPPLSPKKIR